MFEIFSKIKNAFSKTSSKISDSINETFFKRKLDTEALEELETILLSSDVGVDNTNKIISEISLKKFGKEVTPQEIKEELSIIIEEIIINSIKNQSNKIYNNKKPYTILMCGVNGNGKTTSIGKLAYSQTRLGKKVLLAACDTFRAGATEQLEIWSKRAGCDIEIGKKEGSDPASVAYSAFSRAQSKNYDTLFIDTAGRLQNHKNLMEELKKISNTINKLDPSAPHEVLMVLDATTGQNAISQLESFNKIVPISGIIISKLDGTAKAGIVLSLIQKFNIPIKYASLGEEIEDITEFNSKTFARSLVGLQF